MRSGHVWILFLILFSTEIGAETTLYKHALVWDGTDFVKKDFATSESVFIPVNQVGEEAKQVNLRGKFVVPPYANAHHHITQADEETSKNFLRRGVFYVWNPNSMTSFASEEKRNFYVRKDTYDVQESLGGITEPGGHPEKLYVDFLSKWVYKRKERDFFVDNAFYYGRHPEEIDNVLDRLVDHGADFVKIYLLFSEEYEKRRNDAEYYGHRGLNPKNIRHLVKSAHQRELPVAAHVETASDFRVAVKAGVDMLAHLPGHDAIRNTDELKDEVLTIEDARDAAAAGLSVVPTYILSPSRYAQLQDEGRGTEPSVIDAHYVLQASNLKRLYEAGVKILVGTDGPISILGEVKHWQDIGAFDPQQILEILFQTGSELFPDRKLGRIAPSHEADFLVLTEDPREDLAALESIDLWVKAGNVLEGLSAVESQQEP